jgi:ribose/xylose/arabinose/galactoside ABC-type transport system permease subunit
MSIAVADARQKQADFGRPLTRCLLRPELPALAFVVVLVVVFGVAAHGFLTWSNFEAILEQSAIIGVIALGLNQVILAGEIDVSVGSGLAFCAWAAGSVAVHSGGFVVPLVVAVGIGSAVGVVNGLLVVTARIPSIIVTLGMLYALRGAEQVFNSVGISGVPSATRILGRGDVLGINVEIVVLLVGFAVIAALMAHTRWGREVPAVGGNRRAARRAGLPIDGIRFATFVLTGACVGLAAMVYLGQLAAVQSATGTGLELQVIAAVVVGGTSIVGGRGSTLAALVGSVLFAAMLNGMNLLGIVERWQDVFTGAVILLAVGSDVVRRRVLSRVLAA